MTCWDKLVKWLNEQYKKVRTAFTEKKTVAMSSITKREVLLVVIMLVISLAFAYDKFATPPADHNVGAPDAIITTTGTTATQADTKVVYIKGDTVTRTEVVYVPKEYPQDADVQIDRAKNDVTVKMNGNEFKMPALFSEDYKFDKGKLVVTESSKITLDIRTPKPSIGIAAGYGNHGAAFSIDGPLYKNASWVLYADKKTTAALIRVQLR